MPKDVMKLRGYQLKYYIGRIRRSRGRYDEEVQREGRWVWEIRVWSDILEMIVDDGEENCGLG